ncbi:SDR family oxidoreductase [Nocardia higoensis]|uniref:SDR family oxidoreductase n=1 Tax=Nocardia higoensis TaxID=228599 RepID=UPI000316E282|nr:sugar nucleotide-binding protein [Nocardia higoensis]
MRILLLGATGLLGGVLYQHLNRTHDVVGTTTRPVAGLHRLDITDRSAVNRIRPATFDTIVHCAGLVDLYRAEQDPALAEAVHVKATEHLLTTTSAKIVYFSTDNVFSGTAASYTESDPAGPISVYGRTKLAAEQIVLNHGGNCVIRLPMLFGMSPWSKKFLDRFRKPRTPAATDVVTNPVYLPDIAANLPLLWSMSGLVHFGGATTASRLEIMDTVRRGLGLRTRVEAVGNREFDPDALRPPRLVLASQRHSLIGRPLEDAVKDMAEHV